MPTTMRFEILDVNHGPYGEFTLRTDPQPGTVFFKDREVTMVDMIFGPTATFEDVDLYEGDDLASGRPNRLAYLHVGVEDPSVRELLNSYKDRSHIELKVDTPTHGRWKGKWRLEDVPVRVLEAEQSNGEPVFRIKNRYKSVEEVFGDASAS